LSEDQLFDPVQGIFTVGTVPAACLASAMGKNMVTGWISVKEMGTFGTEGTHLGAASEIGTAALVPYVGGMSFRGLE